jgi:hypothetical protein
MWSPQIIVPVTGKIALAIPGFFDNPNERLRLPHLAKSGEIPGFSCARPFLAPPSPVPNLPLTGIPRNAQYSTCTKGVVERFFFLAESVDNFKQ